MDFEKKYLKNIDWSILLILFFLAVYSYIGISGASQENPLEQKQMMYYVMGFTVMIVVLLFDYTWIAGLSYILYGIGILSLIGVLFAPEINNAHSWYKIGGYLIQPAEPVKLFTVMAIARYLSKRDETGKPIQNLIDLGPVFLFVLVPMGLIFIQPDLGNALVFTGILTTMLIAGGTPLRYLLSMVGVVVAGLASLILVYQFNPDLFFKIIHEYQWNRIVSWIHPEQDPVGTGYQLIQSLIAIGSGQLLGRGIGEDTQAKYGWIPVGESDFIFTVIAEQLGFIGASVLIFLFFFMIYRMVRIGMESRDSFGAYFVSGVIGMFVFQIFENIGMTIQLMPITGITLPFISYGGSSLLTNFVIVAMVINIGMRRKTLMFD
ncbi:MAG: rod shape-determining protein RodA [Bacillaceae bacterium]|nr:rod shape-determining protein RodA [Bacillaceae bacterium]